MMESKFCSTLLLSFLWYCCYAVFVRSRSVLGNFEYINFHDFDGMFFVFTVHVLLFTVDLLACFPNLPAQGVAHFQFVFEITSTRIFIFIPWGGCIER